MRDIGWMTLREYQLRIEAYQVQKIYRMESQAWQAWENQRVQATTGSGKTIRPKYQNFLAFFNLDDELKAIKPQGQANAKKDEVSERLKRLKEFSQLKAAGKIIPWSQRRKGAM